VEKEIFLYRLSIAHFEQVEREIHQKGSFFQTWAKFDTDSWQMDCIPERGDWSKLDCLSLKFKGMIHFFGNKPHA